MRILVDYDTVEEYRGAKWVNKRIGISVGLECRDEAEFFKTVSELETEGLELDVAGCPAEECGEFGKHLYHDCIAYFEIIDKDLAEDFIRKCRIVVKGLNKNRKTA
ncbi:hypothetical protein M5X00_16530 [Paenibacillus alvei]|uniref:Uncharacterized protein n=1 Tax=Paenibacillus alvei TaxID=44250 RepID=A0ABT4H7B6_PAEAL|nr:hypothetical protein [Paenibacillus alvei]MCY9544540.1 hypothetical protein [Paenibacillus alvei]MCY9706941.1 hypothetical protein [Paenibacillus alvei]MCY9736089.1 hypothetical protein [Paenibacillus alvei]MCY9755847.1 hypothetical protein [Paenibacillus alvei]MCY9764855.1 hypothetical protein [Paenibacillus alvei]